MTPVQRKRSIRFANYLMILPNKGFDIGLVCIAPKGNPKENMKTKSCGTSGCAIGHLPLFSPSVFEYEQNPNEDKYYAVVNKNTRTKSYVIHGIEYFGLTRLESEDCFSPDGYECRSRYVTPQMVGERLLSIVKNKTKDN